MVVTAPLRTRGSEGEELCSELQRLLTPPGLNLGFHFPDRSGTLGTLGFARRAQARSRGAEIRPLRSEPGSWWGVYGVLQDLRAGEELKGELWGVLQVARNMRSDPKGPDEARGFGAEGGSAHTRPDLGRGWPGWAGASWGSRACQASGGTEGACSGEGRVKDPGTPGAQDYSWWGARDFLGCQ